MRRRRTRTEPEEELKIKSMINVVKQKRNSIA
jgi:hypothetical protein